MKGKIAVCLMLIVALGFRYTSSEKEADPLPVSYDLRQWGRAPAVKDQGALGTCWAFASCMALESSLLPNEKYDFSEDHMSFRNGLGRSQDDGGDYSISMAYLLSWQGPVLEEDDPYGDGGSPESLAAVKHVQEVQFPAAKDYSAIKQSVIDYGAVQSSLYAAPDIGKSTTAYYNSDTGAYCYLGSNPPNHDVVIIGWDDDYSGENFSNPLKQNGAFLCLTSWGGNFGDQGTFYVSYEDVHIGVQNVVYTAITASDYYDHIYQNDRYGWEAQIGYGDDTAYCASIYRSRGEEWLSAVGFYAIRPGTQYEVYVGKGSGKPDLDNAELKAVGKFDTSGYYTVPFKSAVSLDTDESFTVIVKLVSPEAIHPLAVEYPGEGDNRIDENDGKSYISKDGRSWEATKEVYGCDICLKVYTKNKG